jgi:hypothetical protein
MKRARHPLQAVLLALLLVLTTQSMARMRMMPGIGGEMVLCTGTGPITVLTDENGKPVGPPHICPDCAMTFMAAVPMMPAMPARPATRGEAAALRAPALPVQVAQVAYAARDPPFLS